MTQAKNIPIAEIEALVTADLERGLLFWKSNGRPVGVSSRVYGGPRVRIGGGEYYVHRLIYALATGEQPEQIDHIDGDRANNAISNLRASSYRDNAGNKARYRNSKSGIPNVQRDRRRWRVRIKRDGIEHKIGAFGTVEEAIAARDEALARLGFHANHGRPPINDITRKETGRGQ